MRQLISQKANKASISQGCQAFGISRSGFYKAKQQQSKTTACSPKEMMARALFEASGRTYGSRRLSQALTKEGLSIGRHATRSLMKAHQLQVSWKRKYTHTTDSKHSLPVADNVLDRQFRPQQPNRAWGCDITYVRTAAGWLYLSVVIDLYSRKVVGWAMDSSMPAGLVCQALQLAIVSRQPLPGLLVHSDRGSQYASLEHLSLLRHYGLVASMSRKGNCWDNAVTERFFLSLKMERVWHRRYANHAEAKQDIADYIVNFYNSRRLHSTLGYLSPAEFEAALI